MIHLKKKDPNCKQFLSISGIDFLKKLLEIDYAKRITAKDALKHHWFINFTNKNPTKKIKKIKE